MHHIYTVSPVECQPQNDNVPPGTTEAPRVAPGHWPCRARVRCFCLCGVAARRRVVTPAEIRYHGQRVIVYDAKGRYECRGVIVGIHRSNPPIYDVQPDRAESMARRMCGIPANQLRSAQAESAEPQHVMEEA